MDGQNRKRLGSLVAGADGQILFFKSTRRSRVHRFVYPDYVVLSCFDAAGRIVGKSGECVVVLKEHPLNPARLEAEEPGKDFFETSGVDRFIICAFC